VPCEAAEEFGVFGHAADMNLKEGKALLERGELLKELFLSELLFRETAIVFVVSVDKIFHDDAPLRIASLCRPVTRAASVVSGWPPIPIRRSLRGVACRRHERTDRLTQRSVRRQAVERL
jgi:hypothetical protein